MSAQSENTKEKVQDHAHVTPYRMHVSTWLGLLVLTIMTVTVSVFGADIYTLSVMTALIIATTKVIVVGLYFMHLKYDPKTYQIMIAIVMFLFIVFIVLTLIDYVAR